MMRSLISTLPFLFLTSVTPSQNLLPRQISNPDGITLPVYNDLAHQHYLINITVGTPPNLYTVMMDTGAADFWLPTWNSSGCAPNPCKPGTFNPAASESAVDINIPFNVSYGLTPGSGMLGEYYNETISLGSATLKRQTFAVANVPPPITDSTIWGILGIGSRYGTSSFTNPWSPVYGQQNATYTPLWEHLYEIGLIPARLFSIALGKQAHSFGSITFGAFAGPESGKYTGELKTAPVLLSGPPPGLFMGWAVTLSSVSLTTSSYPETKLTDGNWTIQIILDTGSPNMYLPTTLYNAIIAPLSPVYRTNPEGNPTPYIPCHYRSPAISNSTTLGFSFPGLSGAIGPTIKVPLQEIIYPFGLPSNMGEVRGENGEKLCYFGIIPTDGPVFLLGTTFLRSVYAVYSGDGGEWGISMAQASA